MKDIKNKRRLRSIILVSAVSAVACGGKAQGTEHNGSQSTSGDGDGDNYVGGPSVGDPVGDWGPVGQPIGDPIDPGVEMPCDTSNGCLGAPPDDGSGGSFSATGGAGMGGMGGSSSESTGGAFIGIPR